MQMAVMRLAQTSTGIHSFEQVETRHCGISMDGGPCTWSNQKKRESPAADDSNPRDCLEHFLCNLPREQCC